MTAGREVAYLTNLYPAPSHSFIRREIEALEASGWRVHRFAHRGGGITLVDPADIAEMAHTTVLLDMPRGTMWRTVAGWLLERPRDTLATLGLALRMSWRSDRGIAAHLGYFVLACLLSRRLRELGCRHVHAHFGTNPTAVACLSGRLCGVTYSATFHGPHEFREPDRLSLHHKIAGACFIATVSTCGQRALSARHPQFAHKLRLVRCGLDAAWRIEAPGPMPDEARLVCVARLDEQKNPLLLIEAAALLAQRQSTFVLTLCGDGPLRPAVQRRIDALGLQDHVTLAGWCSQREIARELQASRALVLASDDEGLPVAIMEAFASGRPAIATDVGGVGELVQTGLTGWLLPRGDAQALADAMQACLGTSRQGLQALADEARRRVQPFDVRASAAALAEGFRHAQRGRAS